MLTLKISVDGGVTYAPQARVLSIAEIAPDIFLCEQKNIKWVVVDDKNNIIHMSFSMFGMMNSLAASEKRLYID